MKIVYQTVVVLVQLIAADLLGFVPALVFKIGNGWELICFVLGFSLGVWGVGTLADFIRETYQGRRQVIRLAATVLVSAIGIGILLIGPAKGFIGILLPLAGAFIGYYLSALFLKQ
jgi:cytochrome c biogenesis protein CcdA